MLKASFALAAGCTVAEEQVGANNLKKKIITRNATVSCGSEQIHTKYVEIKQPHEEIGRNCDDVIGKNGLLNWS